MAANSKEVKKKTAKIIRPAPIGNGTHFQNAEPPDSSLLDDKELLRILMQVRNGNFAVRMPIDEVGVKGKICDTLNEIIPSTKK